MSWNRCSLEPRFWSKVRKSDGCWLWTGAKCRGYGVIKSTGKRRDPYLKASRVSWFLAHGEVPPAGLVVMHRCDNPPCVRPDHLAIGTQGENLADMVAKGRNRQPPGERNGRAKLTLDNAIEIRRRLKGGDSPARLAEEFGVSHAAVWFIGNGRHWKQAAEAVP